MSSVQQWRALVDAVVNRLAAAGNLLVRRKHRRWCQNRAWWDVMRLINCAGGRSGDWNGNTGERWRRQSMSTVMMVMVVPICRTVIWTHADGTRSAVVLPRGRDVAAGTRRSVAARDQLDAGGGTRRRVCPCGHRQVCRGRHRSRTAHWDTLWPSQQCKWRVGLCRVRTRSTLQSYSITYIERTDF